MEKSKIKNKKERRALLFTAHPDDHLLCAGTLMLLKEKGFKITEVVFTGGEQSVWFGPDNAKANKEALKQKRKKELSKASRVIGIEETIFLDEPDSEVVRSMNLIHRIMAIVREVKPQIVFALHYADYHPDHRAVSTIATEALDRASWGVAPHLGEAHRADMLLYTDGEYQCRGDFIVDVSRFEKKIEKVMDAYGSQMREKHRRLLRSIHMYRGFFRRGATSAEVFEIGERYPINLELFSLLS
jgi:LmbE family N-acetylglucosaminyl deacetylase